MTSDLQKRFQAKRAELQGKEPTVSKIVDRRSKEVLEAGAQIAAEGDRIRAELRGKEPTVFKMVDRRSRDVLEAGAEIAEEGDRIRAEKKEAQKEQKN